MYFTLVYKRKTENNQEYIELFFDENQIFSMDQPDITAVKEMFSGKYYLKPSEESSEAYFHEKYDDAENPVRSLLARLPLGNTEAGTESIDIFGLVNEDNQDTYAGYSPALDPEHNTINDVPWINIIKAGAETISSTLIRIAGNQTALPANKLPYIDLTLTQSIDETVNMLSGQYNLYGCMRRTNILSKYKSKLTGNINISICSRYKY